MYKDKFQLSAIIWNIVTSLIDETNRNNGLNGWKEAKYDATGEKKQEPNYQNSYHHQPTFFMIPVFLLLNVVYLLSLLSMNSILILTRPLVFFPAAKLLSSVSTLSPESLTPKSEVEHLTELTWPIQWFQLFSSLYLCVCVCLSVSLCVCFCVCQCVFVSVFLSLYMSVSVCVRVSLSSQNTNLLIQLWCP